MKKTLYIYLLLGLICGTIGCSDKESIDKPEVVNINLDGINLVEGIHFDIEESDALQLNPSAVTEGLELKFNFKSNDESVVKVDASGMVTPVGVGETIIVVRCSNQGYTYLGIHCKVKVTKKVKVEEITVVEPKLEVLIGTKDFSVKENFSVSPENVDDGRLTYSSSKPEVVAVDPLTGLLDPIAVGTVTITATTMDGSNISATCIIDVVPRIERLSREGWDASASDIGAGMRATNAITDGISFWNSSNRNVFPKWLLIDMSNIKEDIYNICVQRREPDRFEDTRNVNIYISESDVGGLSFDDPSFVKIGELDFGEGNTKIFELNLPTPSLVKARYVKLEFPNSNRANTVSIQNVYIDQIIK